MVLPNQVVVFRRTLELARLLQEKPRSVVDLAERLDLEPRAVQRLIAQLRRDGFDITTEARERSRLHRLTRLPSWASRAVYALAHPAKPEATP